MANNRMFLCHRPTGVAVYLGKHMGLGWYDVPDDLAARVRQLFEYVESEEVVSDDFCVALEQARDAPAACEYNAMAAGPDEAPALITLSPLKTFPDRVWDQVQAERERQKTRPLKPGDFGYGLHENCNIPPELMEAAKFGALFGYGGGPLRSTPNDGPSPFMELGSNVDQAMLEHMRYVGPEPKRKRYMAFTYDGHYPQGASQDERGTFDTIEEAKAANTIGYEYTDVLDLDTGEWV